MELLSQGRQDVENVDYSKLDVILVPSGDFSPQGGIIPGGTTDHRIGRLLEIWRRCTEASNYPTVIFSGGYTTPQLQQPAAVVMFLNAMERIRHANLPLPREVEMVESYDTWQDVVQSRDKYDTAAYTRPTPCVGIISFPLHLKRFRKVMARSWRDAQFVPLPCGPQLSKKQVVMEVVADLLLHNPLVNEDSVLPKRVRQGRMHGGSRGFTVAAVKARDSLYLSSQA